MLPRIFLASILSTALPISPASGIPITVVGWGGNSCGTWTKEHKVILTTTGVRQEDWAMGFLSGLASAVPQTVDHLAKSDNAGMMAWITNYCEQHPLEQIARAAYELFLELSARP